MVTRDIIEEYTKYIDPSEMIIEYYKNQTTAGLEKYFLQIEDWLAADVPPEKNKPLIIQADEGVGKKTLLVQWMKYHQQKSQKNFPDLIISHFAGTDGNNQNYFYALYKILVRLREHFDVSQKVELLENKLESYFHYWLDVCSRALAGRIVDDSTIVLVFEGINLFRDPDTKEEANVGLWLPKTFPYRIKVIITAESDSQALKYFESIGCEMIAIEDEPIIHSTLVSHVLGRESFIADEEYRKKVVQILNSKSPDVLRNSLFVRTYLSALLPYPSETLIKNEDINKDEFKTIFQKMDFKKLESLNDINDFNIFLLEYFSQNIMDYEKFKGVMVALNITEKGLSEAEIFTLTGASIKEWNFILAIFKTFMMKFRDLWKINNETFKKAIRHLFQDEPGYTIQLHSDIAEILNKKTSNSIRKLEEETYHLFMSKNYFKLKEAVANIENFLLLFNPNNKYDLCRYWQILEQRGFDPSAEYTKAVEGFELHYRPNQEDTFMIILQVSRFLKEFSDFETNVTPEFRHPPIKGGTELKEIGLRREIKKLTMYQPEEWEAEDETLDELDELEHKLTKEFPDYSDTMIKEMVQQIHSATHHPKQQAAKQPAKQAETKAPGQEGEVKLEETLQSTDKKPGKLKSLALGGKEKKGNELFLLNPMEALNVDIPDNREKFKSYFLGTLQEKSGGDGLNKESREGRENKDKRKKFLDEEEEVIAQIQKEEGQEHRGSHLKGVGTSRLGGPPLGEEGKKAEGKEVVAKSKKAIAEDRGIEFVPTFYYYKRWLWIMFPWVCLSSKKEFNFSKVIYECFSSATEYISVAEEREKTRQALKIAIEAKLKKQSVYAPKDLSTMSTSKLQRPDLSVGKSNKKILPPIPENALFNTSNNQTMRLDTLSPVHGKPVKKLLTTTAAQQKDPKFFITSEYLTPHYITDAGNTTAMEPSMIGKASLGNTTFQNMSLLNRTGRDKSMSNLASNRKVEEMLKNANEAVQSLLLPKYQDSLLTTSNKQVDDLESKVKQLQSQFDDLAYMNKMSAKKLKDLSVVESNLRGEGGVDVVTKAQSRLDDLTNEMGKADKLKSDAVSQGERLGKIILVCTKNKSQNVLGVQSLNYLLTNFKKMIEWERDDTNETLKAAVDLEKLSKQYLKAYQERLKQQERALMHVRKEKMTSVNMERHLGSVYDSLEKTAILANEEMRTKQQMQKEAHEKKQKLEAQKDKNKNAKENVDEMREMYEQVEKVIGLDFDSTKFVNFLDYIEKINDFQRSLYEQKDENGKLMEEKQALDSYLQTLKKAKGSPEKPKEAQKASYMELSDKDQLTNILLEKKKTNDTLNRETAKRTQLLLDAKMTLDKLCRELNVPLDSKSISGLKIPTEEIVQKVEEKMNVLKENLPGEDFEKFQKGEADMDAIYKSQVMDVEPKKKANKRGDDDEAETKEFVRSNVFKKGTRIVETKME